MKFLFRGLPVFSTATRDHLDNGCASFVCSLLFFKPDAQYQLWADARARLSAPSRDLARQYDRIVSRPTGPSSATGGLR
jgi:hypothetical protein